MGDEPKEGKTEYKISVCDSDINFRKKLKKILLSHADCPSNLLFYEYSCGENLIKTGADLHNLIFLNTELSGITGEETARALRQRNPNVVFVFCTNEKWMTPELLKVQPFRYIRKDSVYSELKKELQSIFIEMKNRKDKKYLIVSDKKGIKPIPIEKVLYISKLKRGCQVMAAGGELYTIRNTLDELYNQLKNEGFEYAHSSYLISFRYIASVEAAVAILSDDTVLNISRQKKTNFIQKFIHYYEHLLNKI